MSREASIKAFVEAVAAPQHPNIHNPWRDVCKTELDDKGPLLRRQRLERHLNTPSPRLLIIGEAPGYQGCRYSGLAFTSERQLVEGSVPLMDGLDGQRITSRVRPWSEPSATIVWKALYEHGLAEETVMFNAVPWHPEGAKGVHSNRTPTPQERDIGAPYLRQLLELFPGTKVAALGNVASDILTDLGVEHVKLRHPANGGAGKFREGLAALTAAGI